MKKLSSKKAAEARTTTRKSRPYVVQPVKPLLIVLSGPSGVGKDAILAVMKETGYPLEYITTVTTRPRRATEREGIDYHFVSMEKFQEMIARSELLEWAKVYGNGYGVPREAIKRALRRGRDAIVRVDVQGAASIKKILPQAVFIFIMPASMEELAVRLRKRRTESSVALAVRMKIAEEEIKKLPMFDYVVVNRQGEIDQAVSDIKAIIAAEKCRVIPREIVL
ncbi:MAG: guanylate kinase [Chloroflexi bacterium]|nr:guanylate kinase [Chloroflexota bacterium]